MSKKIIFNYIKEHLDADGKYTETDLPDFPKHLVPPRLGAEDACYYTSLDPEENTKLALDTLNLLQRYTALPSLENKRQLSDYLNKLSVALIADKILDTFTEIDLPQEALLLAEDYFYHSTEREHVKFAVLIFAIYGMKKIKEEQPQLWQDITLLARCEEFTFIFLYACHVTNFYPEEEIWLLLPLTKGWGKIYLLNDAHFDTAEQRLWLVENNTSLISLSPPLAVKIIIEGHIAELLHSETIAHKTFLGAANAIHYFLFLCNISPAPIEEEYNVASIDLFQLLKDLARHAAQQAHTPADILILVEIDTELRNAVRNEKLYKLSFNQNQLLSAEFEKLIFATDWSSYIPEHIINADGTMNYDLADLAYVLSVDVWDIVYPYFCQHPKAYQLQTYLLNEAVPQHAEQTIAFMEEHISCYLEDEQALILPLKYLQGHPGKGLKIIKAALLSLYDAPRTLACVALQQWGPQYITAGLLTAIDKACKLAQTPLSLELLLKIKNTIKSL